MANRIVCALFVVCCLCLVYPDTSLGSMPGGKKEIDAHSDKVDEIASFAHMELEKQRNSLFATRRLDVTKATSQVVAGIKYELTMILQKTDCRKDLTQENLGADDDCNATGKEECHVTVLEQLWRDPPRELLSTNCNSIEEKKTTVGSGGVFVGGEHDIELDSDLVKGAVNHVVKSLNGQSQGWYEVGVSKILSAKSQLVAGVLINVTFEISLTSCQNVREGVTSCTFRPPRRELTVCQAVVWDQAWKVPRYQLLEHQCMTEDLREDTTLRFEKRNNHTPKKMQNNLIGAGGHDGGVALDDRPKIGYEREDFEAFKVQYGREYKSVKEEVYRFEVFQANMRRAQIIQDHDLGDARYGATQFADYTPEEFKKFVSAKPWDKRHDSRMQEAEIPSEAPPRTFDWRDKGVVTEVKNQGACGSCWAFSVTGNIEGQWAIQKKKLVSLSEQELVDCDKLDEGCNGGLPSNAYTEIQRLGGLETEGDYPYRGEDEKCVFLKDHVKVYINGSLNISKNEDDMAKWLVKNGPMSIGINAMAMQFYFGGVSHPWKLFCPDVLDHGVLIVGYGIKKHYFFGDTPYWIIKNSWGTGWGEKGYYLVYKGDGTCGLNEMVSSAIVN